MVWGRVLRISTSKETGQTNGDNLNNVRHETGLTLRNKKREYLKEKLISLNHTEQKCKRLYHLSSLTS